MVIVKEPFCDAAKVKCTCGLLIHVHTYICTCTCTYMCKLAMDQAYTRTQNIHVTCVHYIYAPCVACQVCDLVLGKVPGSQVVTDVGAELSFILPSTATHHFPALFDSLEGQTCILH